MIENHLINLITTLQQEGIQKMEHVTDEELMELVELEMESILNIYKFDNIAEILDLNEETIPDYELTDEDMHIEI